MNSIKSFRPWTKLPAKMRKPVLKEFKLTAPNSCQKRKKLFGLRPPLLESVIWIVFQKPMQISADQCHAKFEFCQSRFWRRKNGQQLQVTLPTSWKNCEKIRNLAKNMKNSIKSFRLWTKFPAKMINPVSKELKLTVPSSCQKRKKLFGLMRDLWLRPLCWRVSFGLSSRNPCKFQLIRWMPCEVWILSAKILKKEKWSTITGHPAHFMKELWEKCNMCQN